MPDDIKGELSIAPGMCELRYRGAPQRDAAKDEGASMVGEFLLAVFALLADEADCIELPAFAFRKAERWEYGLNRGKTRQGLVAAEGGV